VLTPGLSRPEVSKAHVCSNNVPGIRHPSFGTKNAVLIKYGLTSLTSHDYVVDELIPTKLGGTSTAKNLWPLRRTGPGSLVHKQQLAATLLQQVCGGRTTLAEAQRTIADDWWAAYKRIGK
jgi:hypothetical protein